MFQKEVAEKIVGEANSRIGRISILTQLFSKAKMEFCVDKKNFLPVSKIDSAIVSFYSNNSVLGNDQYQKLKKLLNMFLQKRRKKMHTIMKSIKNNDFNITQEIPINLDHRLENITLNQWIYLLKFM